MITEEQVIQMTILINRQGTIKSTDMMALITETGCHNVIDALLSMLKKFKVTIITDKENRFIDAIKNICNEEIIYPPVRNGEACGTECKPPCSKERETT